MTLANFLAIILTVLTITLMFLIPIALIIFIVKYISKSIKEFNTNNHSTNITTSKEPNSKHNKYPLWEKINNPDGTYTYKIAGYSKYEQQQSYNPYQRADILTPTEYKFWEKLYFKCSSHNLIVCPKVRMEDIINVDKNHKSREMLRNKIKSRHIDFIICDSHLRVLAGLELDDKSHLSQKAQQADNFKNEVFNSLDIPLFRIKVEPNKYAEEIVRVISGLKTMNGIVDDFKPNYTSGHQSIHQ